MPFKDKDKEKAYCKAYHLVHKEKKNAYSKLYYANHKEEARAYAKVHSIRKRYLHKENELKRKYGITLIERNVMLSNQNGQCAICNKELEDRNACIDHDHETEQIRGILCMQCNCMLGNARDNSSILIRAAKYIDSSKGSRLTSGKDLTLKVSGKYREVHKGQPLA